MPLMASLADGGRRVCKPAATLTRSTSPRVALAGRTHYSLRLRILGVVAPRLQTRMVARRRLGLHPVPWAWARVPFVVAHSLLLVLLVPSRSWSSSTSTAEPTPSAPEPPAPGPGDDSSTVTVFETVTAPGDPVIVTVPGDTVVVTESASSALDADFVARVDDALGQLVLGVGALAFFVIVYVVASWGLGGRRD